MSVNLRTLVCVWASLAVVSAQAQQLPLSQLQRQSTRQVRYAAVYAKLFAEQTLASQSIQPFASTTKPDCKELGAPYQWSDGSWSCVRFGNFQWFAAGMGWISSISGSTPSNAGIKYSFQTLDQNGQGLLLDTQFDSYPITAWVGMVTELGSNHSVQYKILGTPGEGPNYSTSNGGVVQMGIGCPDYQTCKNQRLQLIYQSSANGWSLAVPVIWDDELADKWMVQSTELTDGSIFNSFSVLNADTFAQTITVNLYDMFGNLVASATTSQIPANGTFAQGLKSWLSLVGQNFLSGNNWTGKLEVVCPGLCAFNPLQFQVPAAPLKPSATSLIAAVEQ
jgi:hypothetical protein